MEFAGIQSCMADNRLEFIYKLQWSWNRPGQQVEASELPARAASQADCSRHLLLVHVSLLRYSYIPLVKSYRLLKANHDQIMRPSCLLYSGRVWWLGDLEVPFQRLPDLLTLAAKAFSIARNPTSIHHDYLLSNKLERLSSMSCVPVSWISVKKGSWVMGRTIRLQSACAALLIVASNSSIRLVPEGKLWIRRELPDEDTKLKAHHKRMLKSQS